MDITMNCKQAQKIIHLYAESLLEGDLRLEAQGHLDACEQCKARLDALLEVYSRIDDDLAEYSLDNFLATRVWAGAMNRQKQRLGTLPPLRAMAISVTAAAGIILRIVMGVTMQPQAEWQQVAEQEWQQLSAEYFPDEVQFEPYNNIE